MATAKPAKKQPVKKTAATANRKTAATKKDAGYGGKRQGEYKADRPWDSSIARETQKHPDGRVKRDDEGNPIVKTYKRGESAKDKTKPYNRRGEDPNYVPPTPETRRRKNAEICGAQKSGKSDSGPGICCQTAGWGTSHPGVGRCRNHGGNLPGHVVAAEKEKAKRAVAMFGLPVEVDPHTALMEEIWRTNGHVIWLGTVIAELDSPDKLKQMTDAGVQPSVWVSMYENERAHLVKVSAEAIKCGVAERTIQLAEDQGRLMAMVMQAFIRDPELELTPAQLVHAPKILRKHMSLAPSALEAATPEQTVVIDV